MRFLNKPFKYGFCISDLLHKPRDLLHQPRLNQSITPNYANVDERLQVRFSQRPRRPRFYSPDLGAGSARRAGAFVDDHRLYWFRLHSAVAACRLTLSYLGAPLAAADRPQADHADGWRHHPRRRSLG